MNKFVFVLVDPTTIGEPKLIYSWIQTNLHPFISEGVVKANPQALTQFSKNPLHKFFVINWICLDSTRSLCWQIQEPWIPVINRILSAQNKDVNKSRTNVHAEFLHSSPVKKVCPDFCKLDKWVHISMNWQNSWGMEFIVLSTIFITRSST